MDAKSILTNVDREFNSLVTKGANRKTIIWRFDNASQNQNNFEKIISIAKVDDEKLMVYVIVYSHPAKSIPMAIQLRVLMRSKKCPKLSIFESYSYCSDTKLKKGRKRIILPYYGHYFSNISYFRRTIFLTFVK